MFVTLGIIIVASIALGYALRGRIERLANLRFKWVALLLAALAVEVVPLFITLAPGPSRAFIVLANAGVLSFLVLNLAGKGAVVRAGIAILLLGWLLNAAAAVANGAMPLSRWAWSQANHNHPPPITSGKGGFFKVVAAGPGTSLRPLGDVIPLPPIREVLSIGDFLLIFGIGVIIVGGMRAPAKQTSSSQTL